ncbi:protein aubergine [Episyrphus balteatus]|nr:protein aubergine [Episyrphus balteatus]
MEGQKGSGAGRARGQGRASRQQQGGSNGNSGGGGGGGGGRRPPNIQTPGQQGGGNWRQGGGNGHGGGGNGYGGGGGGGNGHRGGGEQQSAWGGQRGGQQQGAWGGGPPHQRQPQQQAPPPQQSAWGQGARQPTPSTSAPTAAPQQRAPAPSTQGRATSHGAGAEVVKEDARGAVRGRRVITEFIATRPKECISKTGKSGQPVTVQANYYRVLKKPKWSIFQYRIDFAPDVDLIRARRSYIYEHRELFGGYLFDGAMLFTSTNLNTPTKELYCKNKEGEPIQIKVKNVGEIKVTDIQLLQVLNLILRRSMEGLNLQLVGRNFFDPVAKICVPNHKLEIWPGYTTSIRQHEQDILLCAEITHKIMRTDTLLQILIKCSQESGDYQSQFKKEVVGMVVLTDYNNKTYRIDDVDFNQTPMSKFNTSKGDVSYCDYYQQRYRLNIRDKKQPLLVSRPTEKNIRGGQSEFIMLIPELSRATGLNDEMKNNRTLMRAIADHTRLAPEPRIERLRMFHRRLDGAQSSQEVLKSWNLQLDTKLIELPGRILKNENILFANNRKYTCDKNADWNREFRNNSMFVQKEVRRWYVIVPQRFSREANDFVRLMRQAANGMKMNIAEPRIMEMPDDRNPSYASAIETACNSDPQILVIVVANDNAERYSCIKKKCIVDRAIPSQVLNLRTIAPRGKTSGLMSVATKVVIQINAKLLGAPWMIELPMQGLMTVGFDVCHSARDSLKSYGALVATMDLRQSTSYFSAVTEHLKGQELSNEIVLNMNKALKKYREAHGALPERILFFRDGVGDGQLQQVVDNEITSLKQKLDQIYISAGIERGCRLAFIVVSKRINTRLFVMANNPQPGLVVDDVVTLPERYDFFLVSQSVRQGTVSPTSYNVIHDSMGFEADKLQILAYKMTHMYYNWSGTCRVPAVCQYAHKLAFMVAQYLHRAPSNALESQLYFL